MQKHLAPSTARRHCGSLNDRRACIRLSGFKGSHETVSIIFMLVLAFVISATVYRYSGRDGVIMMPLTTGEGRAVEGDLHLMT